MECYGIIVVVMLLVIFLFMSTEQLEYFGSGPAIFQPHDNTIAYDNVNMEPMYTHTH